MVIYFNTSKILLIECLFHTSFLPGMMENHEYDFDFHQLSHGKSSMRQDGKRKQAVPPSSNQLVSEI